MIEPFDPEDPKLSTIYFRASSKRRVYSIEPYKILEFLGELGGLLEFFLAIGFIITYKFVKNQYERALIGDTYQV